MMSKVQVRLALLVLGILLGGLFLYWQLCSSSAPSAQQAYKTPGKSFGIVIRHVLLHEELLKRFRKFENERSRRNHVLLEEVVAAYMRADSAECLGVLRSANALSLVSPHSLATAASQMDLDDFAGVLRIFSEVDGDTGDALIKKAFRRAIDNDPEKAFEYLAFLPRNLLDELSDDLARSWGATNSPAAAAAFYKAGLLGAFNVALIAWSGKDLDSAYKYVSSVEGGRKRDMLMEEFFRSLPQENPEGAVRLMIEHADDFPHNVSGSLIMAFANLYGNNEQKELIAAASLPLKAQQIVYHSMAQDWVDHHSDLAIRAASQLPVSEFSLGILRSAAANLASSSKDPYSAAQELTDPYQRTAAIEGISKALITANGLDGLTEIVRHGLSSNSQEWLETAATLISSSQLTQGKSVETRLDWKLLPQDVLDALANHAARNWPPEAATALRAKLP